MQFLWLALLLISPWVHADRITQMEKVELCAYTAKLEVAGMYYFVQGTPREQVKFRWHGDETENEIQFVNAAIDHAYDWLGHARENKATETYSPQAFGGMIYLACIHGQAL